jgi:hypothetical protein
MAEPFPLAGITNRRPLPLRLVIDHLNDDSFRLCLWHFARLLLRKGVAYATPMLTMDLDPSRTDGHQTGYAKPISFGVGAWFPPVKEGRGSSSLGSSVFGGDLPALLTQGT